MNTSFTDSISLNGEIIIQKGPGYGNGMIPNSISVRAISIVASKTLLGRYPSFYIKGIHSGSNWGLVESGSYVMEGIGDGQTLYFYVRSDSTITINLFVKGET